MDARITEFAVAEAKARFSELLVRAEAGEEIVIKRHGKAVARLSPPARRAPSVGERIRAWEDWFDYRAANGSPLGPDFTVADLLNDTRGD